MAKKLKDYEPLFVVREALSHKDIFYDIAGKVIPLVTEHPWGWLTDRHFHPDRRLDFWCPCCQAKYELVYELKPSCNLCVAAWRLSAVSKYMRDSLMAHGRSKHSSLQEWLDWVPPRKLGLKRGYEPHSQTY